MIIDLPDFEAGTPQQISAAERIRFEFVSKLVDRGFEQADIQNLVSVRCSAKWWLNNASKLGVMDAIRQFKAVDKLITLHGSVGAAAEEHSTLAAQQHAAYLDYQYLSKPMYLT